MKTELPLQPDWEIKAGWEGELTLFPWYYFVLNIPTPVFMVTTRKENGCANLQLNAWGMLLGAGREPKFVLQVMKNSDTCRLIAAQREFVVNFPPYALRDKFAAAAAHYTPEADEVVAAGLTPEPAKLVDPPRIKECYAHLECRLDWMRDVETAAPVNALVCGSVIHAAMDGEYLTGSLETALAKRDIPYFAAEFYNHAARAVEGMGAFIRPDTTKIDQA